MKRSIHGAWMVRDTLAKLIKPLHVTYIILYLLPAFFNISPRQSLYLSPSSYPVYLHLHLCTFNFDPAIPIVLHPSIFLYLYYKPLYSYIQNFMFTIDVSLFFFAFPSAAIKIILQNDQCHQ